MRININFTFERREPSRFFYFIVRNNSLKSPIDTAYVPIGLFCGGRKPMNKLKLNFITQIWNEDGFSAFINDMSLVIIFETCKLLIHCCIDNFQCNFVR